MAAERVLFNIKKTSKPSHLRRVTRERAVAVHPVKLCWATFAKQIADIELQVIVFTPRSEAFQAEMWIENSLVRRDIGDYDPNTLWSLVNDTKIFSPNVCEQFG